VAWTHRYVFDMKPDEDVFWCSADVGWVTGHSYIVYGPLMNGVTSVMYEGAPDYPAKDIWWELCERYGVTVFYTAPTAIRACIKWGVDHPQKHDLSKLRLLGTVGEPINPKAWLWYWKVIGGERCPIVDTWWQTETGQIMITPLPGIVATKPGSATIPFPGIDAAVLDNDGNEVEDEQGLLVLKRPWPGMLRSLYREEERFKETYFSRFGDDIYVVGDAARKDRDGYFWIIGRVDTSSTSPVTACRPPSSSRRSCRSRTSPRRLSSGRRTRTPARRCAPSSRCRATRTATSASSSRSATTWRSGSASSRAPSG
jgi:acetyl-CoA synthetase